QCASCGSDNLATARFCAECGGRLDLYCPVCSTSCAAAQKFCHACGHKLPAEDGRERGDPAHMARRSLASRSATAGEIKQITILFADVEGSTELIQGLTSEQALRRLQPVLTVMGDAVHRFQGTVNKVQGDGIMALFGAPIAHEDHAVQASYAALAILEGIGSL